MRNDLRIIPFLMVCYFIAFVDRVNAGFAALQMNQDIGLSPAASGLGGGLFYIAYILFEVPSNLAMEKVGARIWIARIMISWGIGRAFIALAVGPNSFYLVSIAAGGCGGRVLSRCDFLFDLLVSGGISRPDRRDLHGCDSAFEFSRLADIRARCCSLMAISAFTAGSGCSCWRRFLRSFSALRRSSCCRTGLPMHDGSAMRSVTGWPTVGRRQFAPKKAVGASCRFGKS